MASTFKSTDDWAKFIIRRRVRSRHALFQDEQEFINAVMKTANEKKIQFDKGTLFKRARIGCTSEGEQFTDSYKKIPYPSDELKPPKNLRLIKDGRANSRGISVLYLASNIKTAIAEVRPWISAYVTIGTLELKKDLILVNLSKTSSAAWHVDEPIKKVIWQKINESFAKPISQGDEMWDYYATQYLSEVFKVNGYDGILYMSSQFEGGYNIVLFNSDDASVIKTELYKIRSLQFEFDLCT